MSSTNTPVSPSPELKPQAPPVQGPRQIQIFWGGKKLVFNSEEEALAAGFHIPKDLE